MCMQVSLCIALSSMSNCADQLFGGKEVWEGVIECFFILADIDWIFEISRRAFGFF